MSGASQTEPADGPRSGRVILLNGAPCVGKTTTARAFQDLALVTGQTWLHVPIDVFDAMLPPGDVPIDDALTVLHNTQTVVATFATGTDIVLEAVARRDNPAASRALLGFLLALRHHDTLVAYLFCSRETARRREADRPASQLGLVDRDHGHVDDTAYDVAVNTDDHTPEQAAAVITSALRTAPRTGRDKLVARLQHDARQVGA